MYNTAADLNNLLYRKEQSLLTTGSWNRLWMLQNTSGSFHLEGNELTGKPNRVLDISANTIPLVKEDERIMLAQSAHSCSRRINSFTGFIQPPRRNCLYTAPVEAKRTWPLCCQKKALKLWRNTCSSIQDKRCIRGISLNKGLQN